MKKIAFLFLMVLSVSVFAQIPESETQLLENDIPLSNVDKKAEFPGGFNAFEQQVANNINTQRLAELSVGKLHSIVEFIVEKDGCITVKRVTGSSIAFNKEVEKAVKRINTAWIPAENNGKKVRTIYRQPVTMILE